MNKISLTLLLASLLIGFFLSAFLPTLDVIELFFPDDNKAFRFYNDYQFLIRLVFVILISTLTYRIAHDFINSRRNKIASSADKAYFEREIETQFETLRRNYQRITDEAAEKATTELLKNLETKVNDIVKTKVDNQTVDSLIDSIDIYLKKESEEHVWRSKLQENLLDRFNLSRNRIGELAMRAEKVAGFFLAIGIFLASSGVGLAIYKLYAYGLFSNRLINAGASFTWEQAKTYFLMTTPTIIIIGLLALVMFRYRSRSLEQMQYYANEVTTLNIRYAAAMIILERGHHDEIVNLANQMLTQERNFVLKKGEATVDSAQATNDGLNNFEAMLANVSNNFTRKNAYTDNK